MAFRKKMSRGASKKYFAGTSKPHKKNQPSLSRGGIRL